MLNIVYAINVFRLGAVEVSLTGKLSLEFNMIDIWRKPFGFQYLAFGNLHMAIGISVGVPLPSFGEYRQICMFIIRLNRRVIFKLQKNFRQFLIAPTVYAKISLG